MAKDPDERPEVASAVIADAERAFGDHVPSVRPRTVARAPKRRAATPTTTHLGRGMRRLLPIKALALAAVTGALVAGALLGHSGGAAPKVSAATPGPPSSTYAGALGRITAALNANRVTARRALREAKGAKAQARTADTLSGAYASASASLRSVRPPSDASRAHAAAVAALAKAEGAYQRLARAISTSDPRAYARAGAAATAAETALARALASLRPLGYRLR